MTVKLKSLKADLQKEADGAWIEYPEWSGVSFNVRSLHVPSYTIKRDQLVNKLARKYGRKPIPPEVKSKEFGRLYHEEILRGWMGLDEEYSAEVALKILTDPAYRAIVGAVEYCASQVSETDIEFIEEASKNSEAPSGTN